MWQKHVCTVNCSIIYDCCEAEIKVHSSYEHQRMLRPATDIVDFSGS